MDRLHFFFLCICLCCICSLNACDSGLFDDGAECQSNQDCAIGLACIINPYASDEEGNPVGECAPTSRCSCEHENEVCIEREFETPICKLLYTDRFSGDFCHTSSVCQSGICGEDINISYGEEQSYICLESSSECADECPQGTICAKDTSLEDSLEAMCLNQLP